MQPSPVAFIFGITKQKPHLQLTRRNFSLLSGRSPEVQCAQRKRTSQMGTMGARPVPEASMRSSPYWGTEWGEGRSQPPHPPHGLFLGLLELHNTAQPFLGVPPV
ncbi:unnamed protein product [Gulo gulo]|uniref:Uncharacterized protein n=1 Tax=Gulo gulo TaxID=48420 RepID=A0A9X9Q8X9_GULGU|nr:unnamed protein product [Gulo gulo]